MQKTLVSSGHQHGLALHHRIPKQQHMRHSMLKHRQHNHYRQCAPVLASRPNRINSMASRPRLYLNRKSGMPIIQPMLKHVTLSPTISRSRSLTPQVFDLLKLCHHPLR